MNVRLTNSLLWIHGDDDCGYGYSISRVAPIVEFDHELSDRYSKERASSKALRDNGV